MQPLSFFVPIIFTLFLWWFTTGVIMAVFGRARWLLRLYFAGATVVLVGALTGVVVSRHFTGPFAIYFAVTCSVLVWSWLLTGYYLGFITGPDSPAHKAAAHRGRQRGLLERFRLTLYLTSYHEVLALVLGVVIAALTLPTPNRWALWMYLALWLMHSSAKLNVFLGVRNFHIDLLPRQFHYLGSLLGRRTSNEFFPVSVLIASCTALLLFYNAIVPGASDERATGLLLVGTMIVLGVLEHCLLVLPLPATLWGWGIRTLPEPRVMVSRERASARALSETGEQR